MAPGRDGPRRTPVLGANFPFQCLLGIWPGLHLSSKSLTEASMPLEQALIQGGEHLYQGPCGVTLDALFNLPDKGSCGSQ